MVCHSQVHELHHCVSDGWRGVRACKSRDGRFVKHTRVVDLVITFEVRGGRGVFGISDGGGESGGARVYHRDELPHCALAAAVGSRAAVRRNADGGRGDLSLLGVARWYLLDTMSVHAIMRTMMPICGCVDSCGILVGLSFL